MTFFAVLFPLGFRTVNIRAKRLTVRFDQDSITRRLMTAKLFTGSYNSEIRRVSPWHVIRTTARAMVS